MHFRYVVTEQKKLVLVSFNAEPCAELYAKLFPYFAKSMCFFWLCVCVCVCVCVFQCACLGILIGCGMQKIIAVCNLVSYYCIGLPVGASLMFFAKLRVLGNAFIQFCLWMFLQGKWNEYSDTVIPVVWLPLRLAWEPNLGPNLSCLKEEMIVILMKWYE